MKVTFFVFQVILEVIIVVILNPSMDLKKPLPEEECMKNLSKAYPSLPKDNE